MTLTVRPDIQSLIQSLIPQGWSLELLYWRENDMWEVHLVDNDFVHFGYGLTIEEALEQASTCLGGSFNRAQRPLRHQPSIVDLEEILGKPKKINIGKRL